MRILHIVNHVEEIGNGIVNVAVDLACLQAREGCQVAVVSKGGEYESLLSRYGVQHFKLDQKRTPLNILKAIWCYRQLLKEFQPNLVHAHMMTGIVLSSLLRLNYDYHLVSTVHNEFQFSSLLMGLADNVITVSQAVAKSMIRRGIPERKIRVVLNGTLNSPRHPNIRSYTPMDLQRPAITTVSGMYRRKGIGELIEAFTKIADQFPSLHLYLVGDGPDRDEFVAEVRENQFRDRIHFEGFQTDPQRYMLATDIFVLASHRESFGLVLTEAREAGCAIVASDVDGIPEALDNGQAGILVPSQDSDALANALKELVSKPEKLAQWKNKAKQNLERFQVHRVHQETLAIYQDLMSRETDKAKISASFNQL